MASYGLTWDDVKSIIDIFYSTNIDIKKRVKMINDIISYDDFMCVFNMYVEDCVNLDIDDPRKELMITAHTIYCFLEIGGLLKSDIKESKKLVLENK